MRCSVRWLHKHRPLSAFNFANFSSSGSPRFLQGKTEYGWRHAPSADSSHTGSHLSTSGGQTAPVILVSETWREWFTFLGMPKGYPHTCAAGFPRYFYLSVSAAFVGNFATSIATQTLLGGFFADSSARVWMLKDLAPAILAAFIANKMISYEQRPKFWLVVYAVLTNVSTVTDMFIPSLVPSEYLLVAAVVTSLAKQSALLMFFISRACALQHFATHNNLAEFTKKFNSFGMVIYTLATAVGIAFTSVVTSFHVQLAAVVSCCVLNTLFNFLSMRHIAFRVVNATTGHVIMRHFVRSDFTSVPSPEEVSNTLGFRGLVVHDPQELTDAIKIGPPIHRLDLCSERMSSELLVSHPSMPFAIGVWNLRGDTIIPHPPVVPRRRIASVLSPQQRIVALIGGSCDQRHVLTAVLMSYAAAMDTSVQSLNDLRAVLREYNTDHKMWLQRAELLHLHLSNAGWDTKSLLLDPPEMRISQLSDSAVTGGLGNTGRGEEDAE